MKLTAILTMTFWLAAVETASAFCGFYVSGADEDLYNNATQVVLMREGSRTVLSMQNNYKGPPKDFAMVVPVPMVLQKENVKTLDDKVFDRINKLAAPRLVEYWEQDPCAPMILEEGNMALASGAAPRESKAVEQKVKVEAQFKVGEYDIVVLSSSDSGALDKWLRQHKYNIPTGAEPLLKPYVQKGAKFFVAKIDAQKVKFKNGQATLSPLRFYYDSQDFSLPVRLGLINSAGTQDLIVHILAKGKRYEVANYKNVTIPTNIDVKDETRTRFGEFYAALFDRTIEKNPGAVVTEYSWDASSCDPCPTPALRAAELTTLGADVLYTPMKSAEKTGKSGKAKAQAARAMPPMPRGFVLTRLHARYSADTMKDDLVFKVAKPIVGGREFHHNGKLEESSRPSGVNNFQGRYAIRHEWSGPIACENPRRDNWGGPPGGKPEPQPAAANNSQSAPRGNIKLSSFVAKPIPELAVSPAKQSKPASSSTQKTDKSPDRKEEKKGCRSALGVAPLLIGFWFLAFAAFRPARKQRGTL